MSEENVEIVRASHAHFAKTGQPFLDPVDAEIEVFDHDIPDARNPYRGVEGVTEWLSDFAAAWDHFEMDLERVIGAGARVVSLFRIRAVGAGSGAPVERGDAMVWTFRDDKLVRLDYFNDQAAALEDVGLRE
jgi:ketosteroid isomerase-like protein